MTHEETIKYLQNTPLEHTDIVSVSYVTEKTFETELGFRLREVPDLYRVRLVSHPGPRSHIRTEVWLPENWNGRFVGTGNGGIGSGLYLASLGEFIRTGYACAHTDLGTSDGVLSGYENPDVCADYGWRATHEMTVSAKALIRAFYGKDPAYSYFCGSSTGGLQAYSEAQRYPYDYDGIYAGVPSIINTAFHTDYLWNYVHLHGRDRKPLFSPDDFFRLSSLSAAYFQERGDGEPGDCFVTEPYHGPDTVDSFLSYLEIHAPELTAEQRNALRAVYTGPVDKRNGKRLSPGLPIGGELDMAGFSGEECPGLYPFFWAFGTEFDPYAFDFAADFDVFEQKMGKYINAVDPDLRPFRDRGGKLLAFSGTADTVVLYPENDRYYERAAALLGGAEECMKFFRYFLLPGRSHGYGIGADRISSPGRNGYTAFDALIRWCEEGTAPDALDAVSSDDPSIPGKKPFVRTIYPYGSEKFPFRPLPGTQGTIEARDNGENADGQ